MKNTYVPLVIVSPLVYSFIARIVRFMDGQIFLCIILPLITVISMFCLCYVSLLSEHLNPERWCSLRIALTHAEPTEGTSIYLVSATQLT